MADSDLLDAREAMQLLGINENELQTLVARGDLRAFRSAGTMKFRRDDVSALKAEKGTEPTIIIPASGGRKASGILPAVPQMALRPSSQIGAAVQPPQENATGEIVLDDIELAPMDDAAHTQQVTVQQTAFTDLGGQTVMETAPQPAITGEMTVIEGGGETSAAVTAVGVTGSGRRVAASAPAMAAPAMSRVKAAAVTGVSMATSRRTQAVYQVKTAGPVWTAMTILTSLMFVIGASIVAVMMTKGCYDKNTGQRIIPPFLSDKSQLAVYRWCYTNTAGNPTKDDKPKTEYGGEDNQLR